MAPLPPAEGRTVWIEGAMRPAPGKPTRAELIERLRALGKDATTLVAVFDARAIAGERHVLSAWAHVGRARARGEVRLRDRGAELALFIAGDDQLPRALGKVGFQDDSGQLVVVGERP
ncbi:MAG TPA: KEOPS complex subunit Cgi121, partial [Thermoplasmata archaeon]|nr:KEOPS complex subunit Cgi121 [Thermoplasmata archaeon]